MVPKPDAFLSYTRGDDEYSGGQITMFRKHLERAVRAVTGQPFVIFQDAEGIGLGEHWPEMLATMLDRTRFFIPMVTPSFFESEPCRDELQRFLEAERRAGRNDLILPIYCIEAYILEEETLRSEDPLAALLHDRQRHDWRDLLFEPFDTKAVQVSLQNLARKVSVAKRRTIQAAVHSRAQRPVVERASVPEPSPPDSFFRSPGTIFRDVEAPWCPEMVVIPSGSFVMGSPAAEPGRQVNEDPEHLVTIEKPFALGRYPVTRGEFAAFAKETGHEGRGAYLLKDDIWKLEEKADWLSPGFKQTDRHPVVCVSHEDALTYLAWLSDKTSERYDLPSEAAWEYACRAGTIMPFWTGGTIGSDQANYDGNMPYGGGRKGVWRKKTTGVDHFPANPFGLHDMHGNVWEWCADRWHGNYEGAPVDGAGWFAGNSARRVLRGGSWINAAQLLRSARRYPIVLGFRYYNVGFRCARVLD